MGILQNRHLFRFARVSRHCLVSKIAVYVSLCRVSRHYFTPDRHLFRLAYVSWHHRYFHITVYFGSAIVSRHRYSSHIIRYLRVVVYVGLAIYHGYSAISVSEASSHTYLGSVSRTIPWLITSLSWFGKLSDISARRALYVEKSLNLLFGKCRGRQSQFSPWGYAWFGWCFRHSISWKLLLAEALRGSADVST